MHFYCGCGRRISDTTDYISYKAHIVADQDWFDFLDRIADAIESGESNRQKVIDELYNDTIYIDKGMYQCPECGRIFIDGEDNYLHSFIAEEPVRTNLLLSTKKENWKGFLYADWNDIKPEWSEYHGYIDCNVNIRYNLPGYNDYEVFKEKYYQLFDELKGKGIIRRAQMRRNRNIEHQWEMEKYTD